MHFDQGFPSLSNLYKLLAQASDDMDQETIFATQRTPLNDKEQPSKIARVVATSDTARWKASFSAGVYAPRFELEVGTIQ